MIFGLDPTCLVLPSCLAIPFCFVTFVVITWQMARWCRLPQVTWFRSATAVGTFWLACAALAVAGRQISWPVPWDPLPATVAAVVACGVLATRFGLTSSWLQAGFIWLGQLVLGIPCCLLIALTLLWALT